MTVAECAMAAFALLNSGRALAYVPQIVRVYRDQNGAAAVSLVTWVLFASSNLATAVYAHAVYSDVIMATVFALNTLACLLVVCFDRNETLDVRVGARERRGWCLRAA